MWTRDNGPWLKYNFEQVQSKFKNDYLEQIIMYQKCVNAITYTHTDNLDNIYKVLYNYSLDNYDEYHNTIKSYYTPGNVIDRLTNIIQVDLASTNNIDLLIEHTNPEIDGNTVINGHLVLLKNQNNTSENGIYSFKDRNFEQLVLLEEYDSRLNYSVYVKLGNINKSLQYFLDRNVASLFPTDTDNKTFSEGHNYIIKHKLEYKNLNDVELHGIDIKRETFSITGVNVRHEKVSTYRLFFENIPIGTLPNLTGEYIYITVIGHSDGIFYNSGTFNPGDEKVFKVTSESIFPNGPNFDHVVYTNIPGFGAASTTDLVNVKFEYDISITVGEFGLIFKDTSDFNIGRVTKLIPSKYKKRLRDVYMSSDSLNNFTDIVYSCGNEGMILKSIDKGETFAKLNIDYTENLHSINFYDTLNGITVGEKGITLITEDGGLNWIKLQPIDINYQKTFNSVYMNSLNQALIVGDRGMFFIANKNGNIWTLNKTPIVKIENSLTSYDIINDMNDIIYDDINNYFYVTGSDGLVFRIDTNFNLVFYEKNNISNFNLGYFNSINLNSDEFTAGGTNGELFSGSVTPNITPNSNISLGFINGYTPSYNYELNHVYNDIAFSTIYDLDKYGVGNNSFYEKGIGGWNDVSLTLFKDFKTRLLVLDYKLGRKLYFVDNGGDIIKPTVLLKNGSTVSSIKVNNYVNGDTLDFHPVTGEYNHWEYYIEHNLYDPTTLLKPNIYTVTNNISIYEYSPDNIINGGVTDFIVNTDHTLLKLTNTALTLNPGDLIKVTLKETVPSFETFLEGVFMVISWDGTNARINEIFNDGITNDLYNSPNPYSMEVINLNYLEESNPTSFTDNLNAGFFGFYNFLLSSSQMYIEVPDNSLTMYFNMRLELLDSVGDTHLLDYEETDLNFKYGPTYNLLNTLSDIDPVFIPAKTFIMPQITFNYQSSGISPVQFVFNGNKIVMGANFLLDFEQYYKNTFIDIIHNGTPILTRLQILKMEEVIEDGTTRYHFYVDNYIQEFISLFSITTGDIIELRSRNTLEEISYDLNRNDDVHHDMFQLLPTDNVNKRTYKEGIDSFNTDNYAKILIQDSDIKEHVTGFIYTDDKHDLALNILNVSDDPSFNYEPVEIYDVGVDEIPKRANNINSNNIESFLTINNKIGRSISNIDFNIFSFRLIDGLNLVTLSKKYGWILETEMIGAVIGEDKNGLVWYTGEWLCGTWSNGTWYNGTFHNGIWINGTWKSRNIQNLGSNVIVKKLSDSKYSKWIKGTWIDGTWENGTHFEGEWFNGIWNNGLWLNGQWDDGTWNDGEWKGGSWITGTWNDGTFSMENATSIWYFGYWYGGDFKNGLWKKGFFNQAKDKLSRFGTESTIQLKSIWENGSFVNGEIHTYANVEDGDVIKPLISEGYEYTVFNAGDIRSGTCYGATFKQGNWFGGNMIQGYIDGKLSIDFNSFSLVGDTLKLNTQGVEHFIQEGDTIHIIGQEDLTFPFPITATHTQLGYNTLPASHTVSNVDLNGNIDIVLNSPTLNQIDGTFGGYTDISIVYTVHKGTWENSLFNGGLWLGGTWNGGLWIDGIWDNGKWMDPLNPQP